jgi:hypothetical protein
LRGLQQVIQAVELLLQRREFARLLLHLPPRVLFATVALGQNNAMSLPIDE